MELQLKETLNENMKLPISTEVASSYIDLGYYYIQQHEFSKGFELCKEGINIYSILGFDEKAGVENGKLITLKIMIDYKNEIINKC